MSQVTITITDQVDGGINIRTVVDPPVEEHTPTEMTPAHNAAAMMLEALAERLHESHDEDPPQ